MPDLFAAAPPPGWRLERPQLLAYEDHQQFTHVVARAAPSGGDQAPRLIRRFVLLKPSTVVLDDLILGDGGATRTLRVLREFPADSAKATHHAEMAREDGRLRVTVRSDGRVFHLQLPPAEEAAGEIAVEGAGGQSLVPGRLLASGVLPFGQEGMNLLERWDAAYRRSGRAAWDIGRPSSELVAAVEAGDLRPCRTVELGCGTGTNAVFLAGRGFDVTGIDIAPTALSLARDKAREAQVRVRWILADVTAPPELGPFDLVYDRGCYHGVRRQNAARYVAALRRLTRPGARVLILAGNANEASQSGPPRVKEEEIRGDFSQDFDFVWLRETHFDTATPGGTGALAWSILLKRK